MSYYYKKSVFFLKFSIPVAAHFPIIYPKCWHFYKDMAINKRTGSLKCYILSHLLIYSYLIEWQTWSCYQSAFHIQSDCLKFWDLKKQIYPFQNLWHLKKSVIHRANSIIMIMRSHSLWSTIHAHNFTVFPLSCAAAHVTRKHLAAVSNCHKVISNCMAVWWAFGIWWKSCHRTQDFSLESDIRQGLLVVLALGSVKWQAVWGGGGNRMQHSTPSSILMPL